MSDSFESIFRSGSSLDADMAPNTSVMMSTEKKLLTHSKAKSFK